MEAYKFLFPILFGLILKGKQAGSQRIQRKKQYIKDLELTVVRLKTQRNSFQSEKKRSLPVVKNSKTSISVSQSLIFNLKNLKISLRMLKYISRHA